MKIAVVDFENNSSIKDGLNDLLAPGSVLIPQFKLAPVLRSPGLVEVNQHSQPAVQTAVHVGIRVRMDPGFTPFIHQRVAGSTKVRVWQERPDPGYLCQEVQKPGRVEHGGELVTVIFEIHG